MLLNQDEVDTIVMRALAGGAKTAAELERIVEWADAVACDAALLENLRKGHMHIEFRDDEDEPRFCLTDAGKAHADALVMRLTGRGPS